MVSEHIGRLFLLLGRGVARGLLRVGVRPNHVTVAGALLTVGAGVAIAAGRAWWPMAAGFIVAAGACDLLDGLVAKLGRLESRFGAVLDSVCDRVSDTALYLGAAAYFVARPDAPPGTPPNLTLALLAGLGLLWAYLTSYVRARAEAEMSWCGGGFWQRGERVAAVLLGVAFGHLTTAVWILGIWPLATVGHRVWRAARGGALPSGGEAAATDAPAGPTGLSGLVLWRWKRGSVPFDLHAAAVIAMLVFWEVPEVDPLRTLLSGTVGA